MTLAATTVIRVDPGSFLAIVATAAVAATLAAVAGPLHGLHVRRVGSAQPEAIAREEGRTRGTRRPDEPIGLRAERGQREAHRWHAEYAAVNDLLGIDMGSGEGDWPPGLLVHTAGATENGWAVFEVWESREAQERFMNERLGKALQEGESASRRVGPSGSISLLITPPAADRRERDYAREAATRSRSSSASCSPSSMPELI